MATANNSTVNVNAGASVASIYASSVPLPGQFGSLYSISIADNGQITNGLTIDSGAVPPGSLFASSINVNLTVGANASIGGSTAIALIAQQQPVTYGSASASLTLDNQGNIQSTSGAAITGNGSVNAQVTNLTNETTGTIGGIRAIVGFLNNSGSITGGSGSAIDTTTTTGTYYGQMSWQNSGSIISNGASPTLNAAAGSASLYLTNNGQITNGGTGTAIAVQQDSSYSNSTINNLAGGTISSVGGAAITSNTALYITNAGTISSAGYAIHTSGELTLTSTSAINGAVEADNLGAYVGSAINLGGGGSINGSLTLGTSPSTSYGGNQLIVDYAGGTNLLSSISGTVTIGGTNNSLVLNLPASMALSSPLALPTAFSTLGLQLASGSTVTLAAGFNAPTGLQLSNSTLYSGTVATLINNANLTTNGSALFDNGAYAQVAITNNGTITANLGSAPVGTYAVVAELAYGGTALVNSGTITGHGGNGVNTFGSVVNSGTISADGTALSVVYGGLANSGAISGGNTGVGLFAASATNSGTISGGQIGASLTSSTLTNSGTISASGGVAVVFSSYASLVNLQGGIINGGVGLPGSAGVGFDNSVSNAGIINGNVSLSTFPNGTTSNTYIALAGGVLNGNLNLGSGGDRLVITQDATGTGTYAGITGTVTGSGMETLVSLVTADSTATLRMPDAVFSTFGYDLANDATLTLTSTAATSAGNYSFAGTGTVNLTANITTDGTTPLLNLQATSIQTTAAGTSVPTALAFTSNGNLTVSASVTAGPPYYGIALGAGSSFTNNGTFSYNDLAPTNVYYAPATAIYNGGTVTNNGTIAIGGGIAIVAATYAQTPTVVINTGTIMQIAGALDGVGIVDNPTITNSGTIATGGNAVEFSYGYANTLTNSGTITSADGIAITSDPSNYTAASATINNATGGVIGSGRGQPAIALGVGTVIINSGTINGDVQLGLNGYAYSAGSTYIANGGTLNGNLTFGASNNTLLVYGNATGITGTINAGTGGNNLYAQAYAASANVDLSAPTLATGFQTIGIGAVGSGTTLTVSGPAAGLTNGLTFFGNGTITNSANVNTSANGYTTNAVVLGGNLNSVLGLTGGLTFINSGTLGDGLQGAAQSITNTGTISSQSYYGAVDITPTAG